MKRYPAMLAKTSKGRLRVGAAVGVHDYRAGRESDRKGRRCAGRGQCPRPFGQRDRNGSQASSRRWEIDVVAGNVATAEGARAT